MCRNREILNSYKFLKNTEKWELSKLIQYQIQKCKEILEYAYNNTRFYRDKFNEANIFPKDFKSIDDIQKFPIISKDELLINRKDIQVKKGFKKLFLTETSGSTGKPLVFYRNKKWDARHRAAIYRGYSWFGVKPWEKNGYFWGYDIDKKKQIIIRLLDYLQNRFRVFSYKDKDINIFLEKLKNAKYLEGYSSMIYHIAKLINNTKSQNKYNLKMIKGTSEKIFDNYKTGVKKAFGLPIISEYGSAESGIIAFECSKGNMHIVMENVIIEDINNEIIVTNLFSKSFPIIRYRLGDYIKLNKNFKCSCGMNHYVIDDVIGRIGKIIYGEKNEYPSFTFYYIFKNICLKHRLFLNYQIIQKEKGKIIIKIEDKINENSNNLVLNEFKKYFSNDLVCIIEDKQTLIRDNGKLRDFISECE